MKTENKLQYRSILERDENPENPFTFGESGLSFLVDKENRYFGGLATSDAPNDPDSEEWAFVFSLYGYAHGLTQVSLSPFGCPWDSGHIGFVGITKDNLSGIFGKDISEEKAMEIIQSNLEALNAYMSGDCWGIKIERKLSEESEWEETDCVWGFYGRKQAEEEAASLLTWYNNKSGN